MPIEVNTGATSRAGLYTGLFNMRVVAINPTMNELINTLNIPAKTEPVYLSEKHTKLSQAKLQNNPQTPMVRHVRLEFHLEAVPGPGVPENLTARLTLFLRYEYVKDTYINNKGRFGKDKEKLSENNATVMRALDGEIDLMMFLEALCNVKRGANFSLDKRTQLFANADTSELEKLISDTAGNQLQVLLGVQISADGTKHYQTAFKKVLPPWMTKIDSLHTEYLKQMQYLEQSNGARTTFGDINPNQFNPADFAPKQYYPAAVPQSNVVIPQDDDEDELPGLPANSRPVPTTSIDDDNDLPF